MQSPQDNEVRNSVQNDKNVNIGATFWSGDRKFCFGLKPGGGIVEFCLVVVLFFSNILPR